MGKDKNEYGKSYYRIGDRVKFDDPQKVKEVIRGYIVDTIGDNFEIEDDAGNIWEVSKYKVSMSYDRWSGWNDTAPTGKANQNTGGKWDGAYGKWASKGYTSYKECHTGINPIFTIENGGTLYAGGWTRGAVPSEGMVVIDLDGMYYDNRIQANSAAQALFQNVLSDNPVIYMPIKDFSVPAWSASYWAKIALDIDAILSSGKDVLVCCVGGHGRTGLFVSILAGLFVPEAADTPIEWLRTIYCDSAVETRSQEQYVRRILKELTALNSGE
jgi:protein-tyrosine phosphatase